MARYIRAEGRWMPVSEWAAKQPPRPPVPMILRDFTEAVLNPADGQHYGTRPAYEAATRAAGAVEIGHAEHRRLREADPLSAARVAIPDPAPAIAAAWDAAT